ncbi:DSBA protein [Pelomyxa schiedti]|nr:DSBA protein [Pelomyxa schiedti]
MIDTGTKPNGEEYMAYNRRRWGGDGWTYSMRDMGRADGANFSNWTWWPNTFHAHRLSLYAADNGKEDEVMNILFRYLYEEGKNISDINVLAEAGTECGLPDTLTVLKSTKYKAEVTALDQKAKVDGVDGVPFFSIYTPGNKARARLSSGAQPSSYFLQQFKQLLM